MRGAQYYMVSFASTHYAILAEQFLKRSLPVSTMPTLRAVTQSCGISVRVEEDGREALFAALKNGFPVPPGQYRVYHVADGKPAPVAPDALT